MATKDVTPRPPIAGPLLRPRDVSPGGTRKKSDAVPAPVAEFPALPKKKADGMTREALQAAYDRLTVMSDAANAEVTRLEGRVAELETQLEVCTADKQILADELADALTAVRERDKVLEAFVLDPEDEPSSSAAGMRSLLVSLPKDGKQDDISAGIVRQDCSIKSTAENLHFLSHRSDRIPAADHVIILPDISEILIGGDGEALFNRHKAYIRLIRSKGPTVAVMTPPPLINAKLRRHWLVFKGMMEKLKLPGFSYINIPVFSTRATDASLAPDGSLLDKTITLIADTINRALIPDKEEPTAPPKSDVLLVDEDDDTPLPSTSSAVPPHRGRGRGKTSSSITSKPRSSAYNSDSVMFVSSDLTGRLLGKRGSNIQRIERETGAVVKVDKRELDEDKTLSVVNISGPRNSVGDSFQYHQLQQMTSLTK